MTDVYFNCRKCNKVTIASKLEISKDWSQKSEEFPSRHEDHDADSIMQNVLMCTCAVCDEVTEVRL